MREEGSASSERLLLLTDGVGAFLRPTFSGGPGGIARLAEEEALPVAWPPRARQLAFSGASPSRPVNLYIGIKKRIY